MTRRGITVEFLGLPGVGKSSLSRRVAVMLRERGHPVHEATFDLGHTPGTMSRSLRKAVPVGREMLLHPWSAGRACRAVIASRQDSSLTAFKMIFNWLMVAGIARRATRLQGVHLFDQGLCQALWSIGLSSSNAAPGRVGDALFALAPRPDLIFNIEASAETVARRLRERGGRDSRADAWGEDARVVFMRSLALLDDVIATARRATGSGRSVRLVAIDNERDGGLEGCASRIVDEIAVVQVGDPA